jgi:hypothetical protein
MRSENLDADGRMPRFSRHLLRRKDLEQKRLVSVLWFWRSQDCRWWVEVVGVVGLPAAVVRRDLVGLMVPQPRWPPGARGR